MKTKQIYLAGGCFWGVEKYFSSVRGVIKTDVGYANGITENPTYKDVCTGDTGYVETVNILYDPNIISLPFILNLYYDVIDPTSVNRQGGDIGTQYRTGIYYSCNDDKNIILESIAELQAKHDKPIAVEVKPIVNYYEAEMYHQKYLEYNPNGYCHIGKKMFEKAQQATDTNFKYKQKSKDELKSLLTDMQYNVTQNSATEPPFNNEYNSNFKQGIYVDVTNGEPLFFSSDKFESGCGWPSFSKPINKNLVVELSDMDYGMIRTEVRSKTGNAHLGHVFNDGMPERGGLRYCINSASLRFVPISEMEQEGYGGLIEWVQKQS